MDPQSSNGSKARRPRAARACEHCRLKKNKCDEMMPCGYCRGRNVECVYRRSDTSRRMIISTEYVRQLEKKIKMLSSPGETVRSSGLLSLPAEDPIDPAPDGSHSHALSTGLDICSTKEVSDVNRHTQNVEFYGSSSSMSLLYQIQKKELDSGNEDEDEGSLVSTLYNPAFFPSVTKSEDRVGYDFPRSHQFLDNFFTSFHYLHPILDKTDFLERCQKIWAGDAQSQGRSFLALYYSLLSFGALVGPRNEDDELQWSRKFFEDARFLCNELSMTTDLEMVQCYFFMAKICQNELNPHLAYMYTGLAVRTALAMGINREAPIDSSKSLNVLRAETRTWWEISFSMGRPDTLGHDIYHNRQSPVISSDTNLAEPAHCAIIKCMVDFSKIARTICIKLYLSAASSQSKITLIPAIEQELEGWLDHLPLTIRPPRLFSTSGSLKFVRDPQYMKRQKLVLSIRYHNVRMLLFACSLTSSHTELIFKCLDSAKQTIEIIYETYRHHDFFRTWYYNTTYTLFAVSLILVYIFQQASDSEKKNLFAFVEMAIEILETMDDCVVAIKAAKIITRALARARNNKNDSLRRDNHVHDTARTFNHYWGPLNLIDGEMDLNFPFDIGDLSDQQFHDCFPPTGEELFRSPEVSEGQYFSVMDNHLPQQPPELSGRQDS